MEDLETRVMRLQRATTILSIAIVVVAYFAVSLLFKIEQLQTAVVNNLTLITLLTERIDLIVEYLGLLVA